MAYGKLGPKLEAMARKQGREAVAARNRGDVPPPCPYRTEADAPLTERRLAAVWLDEVLNGVPGLQ